MDSDLMNIYAKRYNIYRKSHDPIRSWILANDPFYFMIVYPAILGTIVGIGIWR